MKRPLSICFFSNTLPRLFTAFLTLSLFLLPGTNAFSESLPVAAFSNPDFTAEMTQEWIDKPIDRSLKKREAPVDLKVMMDQQMFRILGPAITQYAKKEGIHIAMSDGTCGHSAGAIFNKKADMGGFCCPPRDLDRLPGLRFYTLGITPVAILVHPDNPVNNLSTDEAQEVFAGTIDRWSQLAATNGEKGPNQPIFPVARLHCKTRPGHWRLILDNEDSFSPELQEVGTIPDMINTVATNPRAIGHVALWFGVEHYRKYGNTRILHINHTDPFDIKGVAAGDYPFYKTFSVTVWEGESVANPHAKKLVDFLLQEVERLDPRYGIVPPSQLKKAGWRFYGHELIGDNS
ncbi:MAG: substrate-binding domain-containing protein [Magnetococcales bacterium]|nr:substrate-binding domain-containing protein [Magnetococcales bacterium]